MSVEGPHRLRRARLLAGAGASALAGAPPAAAQGFVLDATAVAEPFAALGLVALAVAGVLFGIGAIQRAKADRQRLTAELAGAQRLAAERAALLSTPDTPLYIFPPGADRPRIYGGDSGRLQRLLATAEGPALRDAIRALRAAGEAFSMGLRDPEAGPVRARGRAAGRNAAVIIEKLADAQPEVPAPPPPPRAAEDRGRFERLLDAAPAAICERDAEGAIVWANAAYAAALGLPDGAAAAAAKAELIPGEAELAAAAKATGEPATERRWAVVGGARRAFDVVATPGPDSVAVAAIDVSALAEAEQRLQRQADAHDETLNRLKTAVAIFGPDMRLAFHNRAYLDLWRLDPAALEGKPSEAEILDRLREARRLPEERNFAAFKKARAELYRSVTEPQEEYWHLPDGTTLRIVVQPHPFGGLLHLYEDVSEKLALERSYDTVVKVQRTTLDHLQEAVAFFGTDGRLKLHNAAFAALWDLDAQALAGEPHVSKVAAMCAALGGEPEDWQAMRDQATGAAERREVSGEMRREDGMALRWSAAPLPDGATLLSFVDLTDSVRAEERLIEKNEALETAGRLKTDFIGHVSYQLRTPLTSIIGFAEAMKAGIGGAPTERQAAYLDTMLAASAELRTQIDNMVDLAAIDAGEFELDLAAVDVPEFMANLTSMVAERCHKAGLELVVVGAEGLGRMTADPARLKQVLFNLLSNAIAFTPGGGRVEFGARAEGAGLHFWVSDTGPGIDPEHQPRAFERFESRRVGQSRRGPGLGLALVRSIVELHGGWVALESRPGEGTKVSCHLPRQPEAPSLPGFEGGDGPMLDVAEDSALGRAAMAAVGDAPLLRRLEDAR